MGQNEKDDENPLDENKEVEEKKKGFFLLPFSFNLENFLKELLRFLIFFLSAFFIIYLIQGKNQEKFSLDEIRNIENKDLENIALEKSSKDWVSEEMLINTSDEFANHFIRVTLVINYEAENSDLEITILKNKNLIYAETRKIIGKRKYLELKNLKNQEIIIEEIKTTIQRVIQLPGIRRVFFKDFTIH